jgi:hypothetical protein
MGDKLFKKYAGDISFQAEVSARDAIGFLTQIVNGPIDFGKNKAKEILDYLQTIVNHTYKYKPFVDASYIDSIIGNMVYSRIPDTDININANILLDALEDQRLEQTGSFPRSSIANSIKRYHLALNKLKNDPIAADKWSQGLQA